MAVREALEQRYHQNVGLVPAMRERLISVCEEYLETGQGDPNAEQKLCSPEFNTYWQKLSEVLLAYQLTAVGIPVSHPRSGPDFSIHHNGQRIWIEVITPQPENVPEAWLQPVGNGVRDFPHEEILLRWTAAIREKAGALLGSETKRGYLVNGTVAPEDAYIIAINARLLRGFDGAFDELNGISGFPFAVEATMTVGPLQARIDRDSLQAAPLEHQQRPLIRKPKGAPVPADTFLDPKFSPISAIWAADINEYTLLDQPAKMVVVHNPLAQNPIPFGLLPAYEEYQAHPLDDETYQLGRVDGRMATPEEGSITVGEPT